MVAKESMDGTRISTTASGKYTVSPSCLINWNYISGDGNPGRADGIIVDANKIYLTLSNPGASISTRALLERRVK